MVGTFCLPTPSVYSFHQSEDRLMESFVCLLQCVRTDKWYECPQLLVYCSASRICSSFFLMCWPEIVQRTCFSGKDSLQHGLSFHYPCFIGAGIAQSVQWLCYGLDDRGPVPGKAGTFSTASRPALVHHTQWEPGVRRPGHETDHSPPSSADVKNAWCCTSTPPYTFMAWCF
jgi:hypothetical protein